MSKHNLTASQLLDGVVKLAEVSIKLKDAGCASGKDNLEKANALIGVLLDKFADVVGGLDLSQTAIVAESAAPVAQSTTPLQVFQNGNTGGQTDANGERLYYGRTEKELRGMNSDPLRKLAFDISKAPNVNPHVPTQGQLYEEDWRQALIIYILSNAGFVK